MAGLIHYSAYREFEKWRVAANDYGQALTLGMRIASKHVSDAAHSRPLEYLPDAFPTIEGITRLNVPTSKAAAMMRDSDRFLAYMAIPFHVSVYADFLLRTLRLLIDEQVVPGRDTSEIGLTELRAVYSQELRIQTSRNYETLLDWIQYLRNRIVHRAARVSPLLIARWTELDSPAKAIWTRAAGRAPVLESGKAAEIGDGEVRATLAITHRLATETNRELGRRVKSEVWARVVVKDYKTSHPQHASRSDRDVLPSLLEYARIFYRPLHLTEGDFARQLNADYRAPGKENRRERGSNSRD